MSWPFTVAAITVGAGRGGASASLSGGVWADAALVAVAIANTAIAKRIRALMGRALLPEGTCEVSSTSHQPGGHSNGAAAPKRDELANAARRRGKLGNAGNRTAGIGACPATLVC